jgi:hypothetical protein
MNSLPQRKKSAEEIAKLRESLGIPGQEPGEVVLSAEPRPSPATAEITLPQPVAAKPLVEPVPVVHEPKEVRSLKRSERVPVLHSDDAEPVEKLPPAPAPVELAVAPQPAAHTPKIVRSLRKSEQGPVQPPHAEFRPDSNLPAHRHNDEEISRIRRMEVIAAMAPQEKPPVLAAHLALVIAGYLLAALSACGVWLFDFPLPASTACAGVVLLIAVFILIRKPLSRHHAAFLLVAVMFLIVFGALHYFPQLQHGT